MMTSNVFGVIAAENLGYARVVLEETIATGSPGCRVVVHLKPDEGPAARDANTSGPERVGPGLRDRPRAPARSVDPDVVAAGDRLCQLARRGVVRSSFARIVRTSAQRLHGRARRGGHRPGSYLVAQRRAHARGADPQAARERMRVRLRCDGALLQPSDGEEPGMLMVRLVPVAHANKGFLALNLRIEELKAENLRRRRAEAELQAQTEFLKVTLSSIGDAVITTDPEGRVTFINPVGAALTGWTDEEARGRPAARDLCDRQRDDARAGRESGRQGAATWHGRGAGESHDPDRARRHRARHR